jgi:hypothetical protein
MLVLDSIFWWQGRWLKWETSWRLCFCCEEMSKKNYISLLLMWDNENDGNWPKAIYLVQWDLNIWISIKKGQKMLNSRETLLWRVLKYYGKSLSSLCGQIYYPQVTKSSGMTYERGINKQRMLVSWTLYHKAIAINTWKTQMCRDMDENCSMCDLSSPKTLIHIFYNQFRLY